VEECHQRSRAGEAHHSYVGGNHRVRANERAAAIERRRDAQRKKKGRVE